jgi:hypothetical protein
MTAASLRTPEKPRPPGCGSGEQREAYGGHRLEPVRLDCDACPRGHRGYPKEHCRDAAPRGCYCHEPCLPALATTHPRLVAPDRRQAHASTRQMCTSVCGAGESRTRVRRVERHRTSLAWMDNGAVAIDTCPSCGRRRDAHDRHVRYGLPDPVLALRRREKTAGTWMTHKTARESVMMQVPDVGSFVRVLLPIRLTGGFSLTYGLWLGVSPSDLRSTFDVWNDPSYPDLRLTGRLANAVLPWGLLGAPVATVVRHPDETPYCATSSDETLNRILSDEWDHDLVLGAVGSI